MSRTLLAFTTSTFVASTFYWWFSVVKYFIKFGVIQNSLLGFYLVILFFAFIGTWLFAVPTFLLLKKYNLANPIIILFSGSIIGGIFITMMDTGLVWRHPEGFSVGFIAAATFNAIWRRAETNA